MHIFPNTKFLLNNAMNDDQESTKGRKEAKNNGAVDSSESHRPTKQLWTDSYFTGCTLNENIEMDLDDKEPCGNV